MTMGVPGRDGRGYRQDWHGAARMGNEATVQFANLYDHVQRHCSVLMFSQSGGLVVPDVPSRISLSLAIVPCSMHAVS